MNKSLFIFILWNALFWCNYSFAQNQDFGIWTGVKVTKKIEKKASVFGEVQVRTMHNVNTIENIFFQVGGGYSFTKWYELGGAYRYSNWGDFDVNRFDIDNTFKFKKKKNNFALRLKYQKSFVTHKIKGYRLRIRFKYSYKLNKKFKPYFKAQYFYSNLYDFKNWHQQRYSIGAVVRLAKKNYVDIFYQIENEFNVASPATNFVLGLKYKLNYK
ncbi:MAG: DUF2490 domain-containing protein [Salibacteraceae bacterium]